MNPTEVEITPGEIWESVHGKHVGLRVAVQADRGPTIKVKVIRNQGASGANKMVGQIWSVDRQVFVARYKEVNGLTVKPVVETDLGKLLEAMPPAPPIAVNGPPDNYRSVWAKRNFGDPSVQAKRKVTMDAREAALTPQQIEEIAQLREAGTPVGEIARAYRLASDGVNRVLNGYRKQNDAIDKVLQPKPTPPVVDQTKIEKLSASANLQLERQYAVLDDTTKKAICSERLDGATYWDLMARYKLLNGVITRVLREGGVPTGKAGYDLASGRAKVAMQKRAVRIIQGEQRDEILKAIQEEPRTPVAPEFSEKSVDQPVPTPKLYMAKVYVMEPVLKEVEVEAASFWEAVDLAKAIPHVTRVAGVWEAY